MGRPAYFCSISLPTWTIWSGNRLKSKDFELELAHGCCAWLQMKPVPLKVFRFVKYDSCKKGEEGHNKELSHLVGSALAVAFRCSGRISAQ